MLPEEYENFENIISYSNEAEEVLDDMNVNDDIETPVEKNNTKKTLAKNSTKIGVVTDSQPARHELNSADNERQILRPRTRSQMKKY